MRLGSYYAPDVLEPWFSEKDEQSAVVHGNHPITSYLHKEECSLDYH